MLRCESRPTVVVTRVQSLVIRRRLQGGAANIAALVMLPGICNLESTWGRKNRMSRSSARRVPALPEKRVASVAKCARNPSCRLWARLRNPSARSFAPASDTCPRRWANDHASAQVDMSGAVRPVGDTKFTVPPGVFAPYSSALALRQTSTYCAARGAIDWKSPLPSA